jgi:hypothetical protein
MQSYKNFFITGEAVMVHPFSRESYPAGTVYKQGRGSSIVQVGRFELFNFMVELEELAEWFGLELAIMIVDECLCAE